MAIDLQSKMHEMYKDDIVTKDITGIIEKILQVQEKRVTELDQQRLLGYATWFLDNIEKELGITDKEDTIKKRRNVVRQKLLTRGKVNLAGVEQICSNYLSYYKINYEPKKYILHIVVGNITDEKLIKLQQALRAYVPAHILLDYSNYARTHRELQAYTHEQLHNYRHIDLREKESLEWKMQALQSAFLNVSEISASWLLLVPRILPELGYTNLYNE